jgi:hypothetical protein
LLNVLFLFFSKPKSFFLLLSQTAEEKTEQRQKMNQNIICFVRLLLSAAVVGRILEKKKTLKRGKSQRNHLKTFS